MAFTVKNWQNAPSTATPIDELALEDVEVRLSDYTDAELAALRAVSPINVKDAPYNAVGDGTTDDTAAIQAAINACGSAGGGTVYLPPGNYLCSTRTGSGGLFWCLSISYDNVHIVGAGRGATNLICEPASTAFLFFVSGSAKAARVATGSIATWYEKWVWEFGGTQYTTLYNLAPASTFAKGSTVLTLNTAAEVSNFAAGDWIGIRTGQTIAGNGLPDGEFQRVKSVNVGAGTITVEHGLKTSYAREYYISGTSGLTSTSPTANPAPFAVARVTDRLLFNVGIRDLSIDQRKAEYVYGGDQTAGFEVDSLDVKCSTYGLETFGRSRFHQVKNTRVHITDTTYQWWLSADSTCTDFDWINVTLEADGATALHINEGVGRLRAKNVKVHTPSHAASNFPLAGVNSRGYDIDFDGCLFEGGGSTASIYADDTNGGAGSLSGRVRNCTFLNTESAAPFATGGTGIPGWVTEIEGSAILVTQAATTTTLPNYGEVHTIANVNNITSITASWVGRRVILIFNNTASGTGLTDGSNLKLNGNLVYTPDDTITLVCDGTNWYEVSRSAN